jgi:hypothetical protein
MTESRMKVQELHSENGQMYELIVTGMHGLSRIFVDWSLLYLSILLKWERYIMLNDLGTLYEIRRIYS